LSLGSKLSGLASKAAAALPEALEMAKNAPQMIQMAKDKLNEVKGQISDTANALQGKPTAAQAAEAEAAAQASAAEAAERMRAEQGGPPEGGPGGPGEGTFEIGPV
jgi:flavorubredoxin